jgi:Protease inhibitor Inh
MRTGIFGMACSALVGVAVVVSACSGALAQNTPTLSDAASAMIGTWEFSNADHDKICRFIFRADAVASGYKLEIDKNCPNVFPATREIVAWAVDNYGGLRLLDGGGNAAIELTEAEAGIYDGFEPGQGRYVLQSAAAAPIRSAEDMVGEWAVARGTGKAICTLTLANAPASSNALALKVKPGCDATITRFAPSAWRMDQGDLVLLSARGQTWRFEENDANTWQRVPEGADPVLLVRQ